MCEEKSQLVVTASRFELTSQRQKVSRLPTESPGRPVCVVVVVDSHIQRFVLATGETTKTQQVSHRPIKCQSRLWSRRGTKVNGSYHGDNPLLRPKGCVCVCVVIPFILDFTTSIHTGLWTYQPGSHRISHPPSFCGACLNFSREKDSAVPFPRRR